MTTIPRAEIDEILERYGDRSSLSGDLDVVDVRLMATGLRRQPGNDPSFRAEADELDALADRYEQEAA